MKPNILMLSISAPPKSGAESIQTAKWIKGLADAGCNIDLVTTPVQNRGWKSVDLDQSHYLSYVRDLIIVNDFQSAYMDWFLAITELNQKPDSHYFFTRFYQRVIHKIKVRPDVVYARGLPFSSIILGAKIASKLDIPLFIQMSDPYSLNPYFFLKNSELTIKLERTAFNEAKQIGFTTDKMKEMYARFYPDLQDRMVVFPNVYDANEIWDQDPPHDKFTICFTGNIYGERNIIPFIDALKVIQQLNHDIFSEIHVEIAGRIVENELENIQSVGMRNINLHGSVNYRKSLVFQRNSHILLSVDKPGNMEGDHVFLPSKLLDYTTSGRQILNISHPQSASTSFVNDNKLGMSFAHHETHEMAKFIMFCYKKFVEKDWIFYKQKPLINSNELKNNVNKLIDSFGL